MGRIKVGREKPRFYQPVGLMSASYYAEEARKAKEDAEEARNVSSAPSPEPGKGEPQSGPEKKAPSKSRKGKK